MTEIFANGFIGKIRAGNMTSNVECLFDWFQKRVISIGAEITCKFSDGVVTDDPDSAPWENRSRTPFTRAHRGFVHGGAPTALSFFVGCTSRGVYKAVIHSGRYIAYSVKVDEKDRKRIPISFIVASSDPGDWIYDLESVLNATYDKNKVLCGRHPVLRYPDFPVVSTRVLYYKACRYFDKVGKFEHVFFGKERVDEYGWFKLRPDAFTPFSPRSRLDEAISVELIADRKYKFDKRAGFRVVWYPEDFDMQSWTIFIESGEDALSREQSIDQALYTLLPRAGSQREPGRRGPPPLVSLPEEAQQETFECSDSGSDSA